MDRSVMPSRIAGDNFRDYKKYLEIEKMNKGANNNFPNTNSNNNTNNIINNNTLNANTLKGNTQTNQNVNPMNVTTNSTNNTRVPFVYTPMKRPPTGDNTQNNRLRTNILDNNNTFTNPRTLSNYNNNNINDQFNNLVDANSLEDNTNINSINNTSNKTANNQIFQEINNLKMMLSKSMQNQTEMQGKIIEYNKIINEQENIIRLNNLKLNEHDNKLTEILLSFNNYLQLNEKTSVIINDVQKKMDNFVNNNDFTDLKSTMYNLNKLNENKIMEMNNIYEDMSNKLNEMGKENNNYQKFTLEKLKSIQKDSMDTRLQQQNELIKMEDSKENRINAQFSQIKNLLSLTDKNIKEETEFRKNMINDLRNEILNIFAQKDDQICKLEKTQLETEKNLISLNKDYITSFNELINKHNEKNSFELKSIRSLIEAGLTKVDIKMEKDLKVYEENLTILKSNILEQKTNIANLDTFIKESIREMESKMEVSKGTSSDYFNKFDLLSNSFKQFMEESLKIINTKNRETEENLTKLIEEEIKKLNDKLNLNIEHYDKHFNDIDDKLKDISGQIITFGKTGKLLDVPNGDNAEGSNGLGGNKLFIRDFVRSVYDEDIKSLKATFDEYQKELLNNMNSKIEEIKTKFALNQTDNMKTIHEMFEKKVDETYEKIMNDIKDKDDIRDGKVQEYILESELRITKKYDENIKKIEEDLEALTLKIGIGP
jgi:hypothetical protein